ncbi:MAG TPA: DUF1800 domain-containing protein [Planctomycetota bacterium]|nr:DUF1800 domain-containing protein [Planctomycetota bacterium]
MHEMLKPYEGAFDFDAAAHLWRRAAFGAPRARIEETAKLSPRDAARSIVRGPEKDAAAEGLESVYAQVAGTGKVDAIRAWLLQRMVRCEHQLREKIALFWHGHFATSVLKVNEPAWMGRQYRIFLEGGLGAFGDLLGRVTRDPAMIRWLDNETNAKGHPNENYARELFELFTLGDGNYTENDIKEAARAFTGWHILADQYHFSARLHDDGEKEVLGARGAWNGDDVCRIALSQKACGRFLSRKLLQFFVTPDPPAEVVDAFGEELRARGYRIGECLEILFASRVFHASRGTLVKSPIEFVATSVRVFEGRLDASAAAGDLRAMGQDLLAPPNVKGWPGHTSWINTATWLARVDTGRRLASTFDVRGSGDDAVLAYGRLLCGKAPGAEERQRLAAADSDLAHALLCLPEAHLS